MPSANLRLGFTRVCDHVRGKAGCAAYGLPWEGAQAAVPRVGDVARRDVPRCGPADPIGEVRERVRAAGWGLCVVVNEAQIVLGLLRERYLGAVSEANVEKAMRSVPATYRPDALVSEIAERLRQRRVGGALVTRSGTLVGWLRREDVE